MKKIIKKAAIALLSLFLIVVINFLLPRLMPGDPVLMLTGNEEEELNSEQYEYFKKELGLDKTLPEQFVAYISSLFKGDLGYSYIHEAPVSKLLAKRIPNTLQIALPVFILSSLAAFFLGCHMGYKKGSLQDTLTSTLSIILDSMPAFLLALMLIIFFSFELKIFPSGALNSIYVEEGMWLLDRIWHLALPVITLTLGAFPAKYMLMRNSVAAAKEHGYVAFARARGISERRIKYVHIAKNACQPFLAMLGINLGFIMSGSLICENIFSINGMGTLIYSATLSRDYAVLQGALLVISIMVISVSILTDILAAILEKGIRREKHEEKA